MATLDSDDILAIRAQIDAALGVRREIAEVQVNGIVGSNGWSPTSANMLGTLGTTNTYGDLGRYEYASNNYAVSLAADGTDDRMLLTFTWPDAGSATYSIPIGANITSVAAAAIATDLSYANWTRITGTRTVTWSGLTFRTVSQVAGEANAMAKRPKILAVKK